jgi:hypothetical protein
LLSMLTLGLHLVKVAKKLVYFFGLHIVLAKLVLEHHERLLEVLNTRVEVASLEADQPKSQVTLCGNNVVWAEFIFKEVLNFRNVLDCFHVVVLVYWLIGGVPIQISFCYVFLPNLNDLREEAPSLLD